ncbi:MAG TPA: glucose-6-phosphate dehydrogenase [Terriglobales bacterium]|nr:glucose-6-phosphate dehydrogenase [Terriglobales bacterium]
MAVATLENPLRAGIRLERTPEPCAMVIFGATGDLMRRKLMPALYNLYREHLLPAGFSIVGVSRTQMSSEQFRAAMKKAIQEFDEEASHDESAWESFAEGLSYLTAQTDQPDHYRELAKELERVDHERGTGSNRLFYLAVPPSSILEIVRQLDAAKLARTPQGWTRIIIEKPFGHDLDSARQLNERIARVFDEDQIYRIDHYLGKETVQNLMVFRFANGIFEPIWNRRYVDNIQITAAETVGVENRAAYFEEAGELRDMVQNHLLQVMALTGMEPPTSIAADSIRAEKAKLLRSIVPVGPNVDGCVVRGQYGPGWVEGVKVPGYREEPGVNPNSSTETFVALKLFVENWRWAGVPFYLRAGKRMPKRVTEVAIHFKSAPLMLFEHTPLDQITPNQLIVRIQPDEGISLKFSAKVPGPAIHIRPVTMDFRYASSFGVATADAYERLLLDCMLGDPTLFADREGVEAAWALVTPILRAWQRQPPAKFPNYPAGSWGPPEAESLLQGGCNWRLS